MHKTRHPEFVVLCYLSARGCWPSGSDAADLSPMRTCRNDGASPRTRWCSAVCPLAGDSWRRCSPASSAAMPDLQGASGRVRSEGRGGVQVVHEVKLLAPSDLNVAVQELVGPKDNDDTTYLRAGRNVESNGCL